MPPRAIIHLAIVCSCFFFVPQSDATEVIAFFKNNTPLSLTLNYYSSIVGTFIETPPPNVGPFSTVTWRLTGSIVGQVGTVQYSVDYQPMQRIDPTKTYSCF